MSVERQMLFVNRMAKAKTSKEMEAIIASFLDQLLTETFTSFNYLGEKCFIVQKESPGAIKDMMITCFSFGFKKGFEQGSAKKGEK